MSQIERSPDRTTSAPPAEGAARPSRAMTLLLMALILAGGAFLRFYHITRFEPFITDEAAYHLEAKYLYSMAHSAVESLRLKQKERRTGENLWTREQEARRFTEQIDGRVPWYARPGHIYLIALGMLVWGPDTVYLGALVSAFFGTLCILLVYGIGACLYGPVTGLLAAALFAFSGYQVAYSHTGLTEQDALFFLLLAALVHVWGRDKPEARRWKYLLGAGLALGCCFVVHYRMVNSILAFFVWEALLQRYSTRASRLNWKRRAGALALLVVGLAVPVVLTEVPYYLLMLGVHMFFKTTLPFQTYFEQLLGQFFVSIYTNLMSTQKAFSLLNLLTYPFLMFKLEGPVWPVAILGGLVVTLWRRLREDLWVLVLFLVPFLTCTFLQPRARYACSFLAFGTLLVASTLAVPWPSRPPRSRAGILRAAKVGFAVLLLSVSAVYAYAQTVSKVSYGAAVDFMRAQGTVRHISTYPVVTQVYAGVKNVPDEWPRDEANLKELYEQGYRFLLIDALKDIASLFFAQFKVDENPAFQKRLAALDDMEVKLQPVFVTENLHITPIQNIFEVNHNFSKTIGYYRMIEQIPRIRKIRVYDLEQLYGRPAEENAEEKAPGPSELSEKAPGTYETAPQKKQ